jgi:uncharacterized protein
MHEAIAVSPRVRAAVGLIRRRPFVTLVCGVALVLLAAAGLTSVRADFTHRGYFWDDDIHLKRFDSFERRFGNDDRVVIAIHSPSGVFDLDSAGLLQEMTDKLWRVPEVIGVDSLSNYNWVHAAGEDVVVEPLLPKTLTPQLLEERKRIALADEIIPDYLVSRDAQTALVIARIKPGIDAPPDAPKISRTARELVDSVRRTDHSFYIAGGVPLDDAFEAVATTDLAKLLPRALAIAAIFLALMLRSASGVVLPLGVVLLSLLATIGFAGWTGIALTNISVALPSIMIAVGIAESMHVMLTYNEGAREGMSRGDAATYALEKNFLPTFLTSSTTAIGFVTFIGAGLKPISGLGVLAAFGTQLSWILTYLLLGPLLFLLPLRQPRAAPLAAPLPERWSTRYALFLVRHRRTVLTGATVLAIGSTALALTNEVNSDTLKYFGKSVPIRVAHDFIEDKVGGVRELELVIDSGHEGGVKEPGFLHRIDALQRWIEGQPGVTRALSIVDIIKRTHRSLNGDDPSAYVLPNDAAAIGQELFLYSLNLPQGMDLNDRVTLKQDALRVTVLVKLPTSNETMDLIQRIEQEAKRLGLNAHVTGKYSLYQRINRYVVNAFVSSFAQSVVFIGAWIMLFLRSVSLGIIAMIPNVLPVLAGGAMLRLLGMQLDIGNVLVASVTLGIAVDDTIHVLSNFRRLRLQGRSEFEAMREVFAHTAPALFSSTAVLVMTFATFVLADFVPNANLGILTALILAFALLVDMTLTPVLLVRTPPRHSGEAEVRDIGRHPVRGTG